MEMIKRLFRDEEGQGMAEYAIILAGVVAIAVVILLVFSDAIQELFNYVADALGNYRPD